MVYQINFDLVNSYSKLFEYLESMGNFVYLNKTIYLDTSEHKSNVLKNLKAIISEDEQVMVKSINIDSNDFPIQIRHWIDGIRLKQNELLLKKEQEEAKQSIMNLLNDFENELIKQLENTN